jgi:hypothetical protein
MEAVTFRAYVARDKRLQKQQRDFVKIPDVRGEVVAAISEGSGVDNEVRPARPLTCLTLARAYAALHCMFVLVIHHLLLCISRSLSLTQRQMASLAAAPKSAFWDLKEELEPELQKLDKQTDRAILRILRG